jgi:hypothetical protein
VHISSEEALRSGRSVATQKSVTTLSQVARRQALIMGRGDLLAVIGVLLVIDSFTLLLTKNEWRQPADDSRSRKSM